MYWANAIHIDEGSSSFLAEAISLVMLLRFNIYIYIYVSGLRILAQTGPVRVVSNLIVQTYILRRVRLATAYPTDGDRQSAT